MFKRKTASCVLHQRSRRHGRNLSATPGTRPVQFDLFSLLSAEVDARFESQLLERTFLSLNQHHPCPLGWTARAKKGFR